MDIIDRKLLYRIIHFIVLNMKKYPRCERFVQERFVSSDELASSQPL